MNHDRHLAGGGRRARCEPEQAARTAAVVLPHDWLTWQLGGRSFDPVTDRGDASGTCYFDTAAGEYRRDLILWSLAYGLQTLQRQVAGINRITLTGGAAQSRAVREIARAVFGLPVATTEPFET